MQADAADDFDARPSGLDQSDSGSVPKLSTKLRYTINKLVRWRIDPTAIVFPENACQFHGGHATVSRAILAASSDVESGFDGSEDTGGGDESGGNTLGQKVVAVKSLNIENERDRERVLGLALREAGFLVELSHQNIIKIEGFVEDLRQNRVWLIFPWEANGTLKDFVALRNWEIPERIWLIDDVTRGVEYLHTRNPSIYHGDLKSVNVLINSKYCAVITDFGSARRLHQKQGIRETSTTQTEKKIEAQPVFEFQASFDALTNTITLTGNEYTLRWAAPELLKDDEPGLWSDLWSLGWIYYEVMTNSIPFQHVRKDSMVIKQVIQGDLPSVTDHIRMSLILQLCSITIKCWSINPSDRPTAKDCVKLISWMPMIAPDPQRSLDIAAPGARPAELLMKLGDMHTFQGDLSSASSFYTEALGIYTNIADNAGRAEALSSLANLHRYQSEYDQAIALYSEVNQIYTDIGDSEGKAGVTFGLAEVYRGQEKYSEAVMLYSEALQIRASIGDREGRVEALLGLASVYRCQHENSQAVSLYTEAAQICTDIGYERGRGDALFGLAEVHKAQEEYGEAVRLHSEALQICTDIGDRMGRASSLRALAGLLNVQTEYGRVVTLLSEAVQISTDMGDKPSRALTLFRLATIHHNQGHHNEAIRLYEQAAESHEQSGNSQGAAVAVSRAASLRQ